MDGAAAELKQRLTNGDVVVVEQVTIFTVRLPVSSPSYQLNMERERVQECVVVDNCL